jgi:hypothetical protein
LDNRNTYSPRFSVQVYIENLAARPKNTEAAKLNSQRVMEEMVDWTADACSGRWEDSQGKLTLAVFSTHMSNIYILMLRFLYSTQYIMS